MMAPTCSRAALQLLTTVLLVSTIANAVALPHLVLDPRTPIVQSDQLPAEVSAALRAGVGEDPDNVFQDVEDAFKSRTGLEVIRDFFARIFGWNSSSSASPTEPPVSVTPTPSETIVTPAPNETIVTPTPSEAMVTPPGPPASTGVDVTSGASPGAATTPSPSGGFSILPVGSMTTAINVTLPDPVFSLPPFLNTSVEALPTAVPITEEFSAIPFPGTGLPSNSTATVGLQVTSVILVTATITPSAAGTGTGWSNTTAASTDIPLFPNTTSTYVVVPTGTGILGTGTGSPVSFTEAPLYPNATNSLPTYIPGTGTAAGTGAPVSFTELPLYPNATSSLSTYISDTGTAAGTGAPVSFTELPIYVNTTTTTITVTPSANGAVGTGAVGTGAVGTVTSTGSPAIFTEIPLFPNVTTLYSTTTTTLVGTGLPSLLPSSNGTALNDTPSAFPGLLALRRICQDPSIKVITLPLISRFYGPSGYPTLKAFPGCTVPNDRQAFQAPGLLNCSALGAEVQRCQASGRKVLLSVKADGLGAVGGNANFGDPNLDSNPYGPAFADGGPAGATYDNISGDEDDGLEKRQIEINIDLHLGLRPHQPQRSTSTKFWRPHRPDSTDRPAPPPRPDESVSTTRPHRPSASIASVTILPPSSVASIATSSPISDDSLDFETASSTSVTTLPPSGMPSITTATHVADDFPVSETTIPLVVAPGLSSNSSSTLTPSGVASNTTGTPISDDSPVFETLIPIIIAPSSPSNSSTPVSGNSTSTSAVYVPDSAIATPIFATPVPLPSPISVTFEPTPFPNLFNENHPPTAFALTLFSLFGEGHTERADLRPLGPDVGGPAAPSVFNGTNWVTPPTAIVPMLARPLGEEVVVDGFDVQVPVEWKGRYQDTKFRNFVARLRELNSDAWIQSGGTEGGPGDLGANGKAVVYFGWVGGLLKRREAAVSRAGWIEWDGSS